MGSSFAEETVRRGPVIVVSSAVVVMMQQDQRMGIRGSPCPPHS